MNSWQFGIKQQERYLLSPRVLIGNLGMLYGDAIRVILLLVLFVRMIPSTCSPVLVVVIFVLLKQVWNRYNIEYKAADATVKEDIRQKIIFKNYPNKYLAYIIGFKNACLKTFQTSFYAEDCAASLLMNLGIDHAALDKKVDDFINKCEGDIYEALVLDRNRFS